MEKSKYAKYSEEYPCPWHIVAVQRILTEVGSRKKTAKGDVKYVQMTEDEYTAIAAWVADMKEQFFWAQHNYEEPPEDVPEDENAMALKFEEDTLCRLANGCFSLFNNKCTSEED